jgi:hypothetical protein
LKEKKGETLNKLRLKGNFPDAARHLETLFGLDQKRINLEGNTHAQEINVSQCPV